MAKIFFYICDYFGSVEKCYLQENTLRIRKQRTQPENIPSNITTEPIQLVDFLLNLRFFLRYRLKVASALVSCGEYPSNTRIIKLVPPTKEHLDYHWGERAVRMIWELVELTELMAWLSTLGGAFSALGNYQPACADTAGKISLHQMKLAFRLGDPSLVARCQLYLAISLIQKEQYAAAGHIVRHVYRSERKQTVPETRLLKMCQGIWSKLRYEYDIHRSTVAHKQMCTTRDTRQIMLND